MIECSTSDSGKEPYTRRIAIGGRLLIFILETDDLSLVRARLPKMLAAGKAERDQKGMNRFRCVVATDHVESVDLLSKEIFEQFSGKDEKIHLHVVQKEDVSGIRSECL
ncbi:MAG: hypothetical protein JRF37_12150 [Deltaproteobacteria bacterium]|nr:hypothetical protein [Deltaproteobacteria bacterium]